MNRFTEGLMWNTFSFFVFATVLIGQFVFDYFGSWNWGLIIIGFLLLALAWMKPIDTFKQARGMKS